jgi:DNA-binding NarL/FixJ family response regulator
MSLLETGDGPVRLAVVDDHIAVLEGLAAIFNRMEGYEVTLTLQDARELDLDMPLEERPHIAVVDMRMPHMDGPTTIRLLRKHWPETRVLGLSFDESVEVVCSALDAGACGFITKSMHPKVLFEALESVRRRGQYHNDELTRKWLGEKVELPKMREPQLNEQERRLLDCICHHTEPTWDMAAHLLGLLPCTLHKQRESLSKKLGVKSKSWVVSWGHQRGYGKGLYWSGTVAGPSGKGPSPPAPGV